MNQIKITPELKYRVEIEGEFYYPATLMVDFDENRKAHLRKAGITASHPYVPWDKNTLQLREIYFNYYQLEHLSFPNIEKEPPKIFIHENLINQFKTKNSLETILPGQIKNATEIQNYQKYFQIFKGSEPRDIFSKLKNTPFFNSSSEPQQSE